MLRRSKMVSHGIQTHVSMVELHLTGTFEGRSTDQATAPWLLLAIINNELQELVVSEKVRVHNGGFIPVLTVCASYGWVFYYDRTNVAYLPVDSSVCASNGPLCLCSQMEPHGRAVERQVVRGLVLARVRPLPLRPQQARDPLEQRLRLAGHQPGHDELQHRPRRRLQDLLGPHRRHTHCANIRCTFHHQLNGRAVLA